MQRLSENDFCFNGELGSENAGISQLGDDYFQIRLAVSPHIEEAPCWVNRCQFTIKQNALGRSPHFEVTRPVDTPYWFNEYALSFSEDNGSSWCPILWESGKRGEITDHFRLPRLNSDRVLVGNQVPMSGDRVALLNAEFARHSDVKLETLGRSREGRPIQRLVISAPGPVPMERRCVHYVVNHHPGEGNACWRIVGLVRWLLSNEAKSFRQNNVFHIILMASPDSPSHGWSRCNGEGWDMNRCFRLEGADPLTQGTEPYVIQMDFEKLMDSDAPVTACWLFHTWGGKVAPFLLGGPEIESLGGIEAYANAIARYDSGQLIDPPAVYTPEKAASMPTNWNNGPFLKYGITCGLVEGSGGIHTQAANELSGRSLGRAISEFYSRY